MAWDHKVVYMTIHADDGGGDTVISGTDVRAEVSLGVFQDCGTATVEFHDERPAIVDERVKLWITAGFDGSEDEIFNGEIVGVEWGLPERIVTVQCQDIMARLNHSWGNGFYDYTGQDDAAIVQNLVEKSGVDPSLTSIQSSSWTVEYLELRDGTPDVDGGGAADNPLQLIREIDKCRLYATFTRSNGAIYRRPIDASGAAALTYNLDVSGSGVRSFKRARTVNGIVNKVLVKGETIAAGVGIEQEYSASNSYLPTPIDYNLEMVSSNLITTDAIALELATDTVTLYNRRPEQIDVLLDGDGTLQPGQVFAFTSTFAEISAQKYFITQVNHSVTPLDFTTRLTGIRIS